MQIGLLIPLRAFRRNSGIVTWMIHMHRAAQELGVSLCCVSHIPIGRLREFYLFRETLDDFAALGVPVVGPETFDLNNLLSGLEEAIQRHEIQTVISSDPCDYADFGPGLGQFAPYLYEHSGCYIRKPSAIEGHRFYMSFAPAVKSICVTDQAKAFMQSIGRPVVEAVGVQPYLGDPIPAAPATLDRLVASSGGFSTKRDELAIALCEQAGIPLAGFGTKKGYTHVSREQFLHELYQSQGLIHLSSEEMVPYSVIEAAARVPVIVDKAAPWVKDLEGYGIPMIGIDVGDERELADIYKKIGQYRERLDVGAYKARTLEAWRRVFNEIL